MRLVFLGPPGVGKGTQSSLIARKYGIPHIATGDILRKAIADQTPIGLKVKSYIDSGKLVPDEVIIKVMNQRLLEPDTSGGYVLDGYPRTLAQGDALADFLAGTENHLDQVVYLELDQEVLIPRISGRRVCPACKEVYHLIYNRPEKEGLCRCGVTLTQRIDDQEATVKNRLTVYESETAPLIDYYKEQMILSNISAEGSMDAVTVKIEQVLESCSSKCA